MKVIVYCSVSTNKEAQETSLERQEEELVEAAKGWNFQIDSIIYYQSSGYDFDRPGILDLLEKLKENQIDAILLSKMKLDLEEEMQRLHSCISFKEGVKIYTISHNGELELSEGDSMVLNIVSMVEEYQRKLHNLKIRRGMKRAIAKGYRPEQNLKNRGSSGEENDWTFR